MKISREIIINGMSNNTEYELTGIELDMASNENLSKHDKAEVFHQLTDLEYKNVPDDVIEDLASQFRTMINDLIDEYIIKVIHINEGILEQYKQKWKVFTCDVTQTRTRTYSIRAKDAQEAEDMLSRYFDHHENEVESDMEDELPDYDFGWVSEQENWCDPDNADITEEE